MVLRKDSPATSGKGHEAARPRPSANAPRNLREVQPNVIAVPGFRTPPVGSWGMTEELEQAARNVESISPPDMFTYQSSYQPSSEDFSWDAFLRTGNDLADDLAHLATEYPDRPIIFVAHSLGGVLLKKALLLAHQNIQDARFKLVVECLSGILFMGTPHASSSDEDTLLRHNRILYSCAKVTVQNQAARLPRNDIFQLANLAAAFEQIATIPILSVFEYDSVRSGVPRLFARKHKALVDSQLAKISSIAEDLLGVQLSHTELCKLPLLKAGDYSARAFLRKLFENLAVNKRWTGGIITLEEPHSPAPDPLNPLNLARIDPHDATHAEFTDSTSDEDGDETPTRRSVELPMRLHIQGDNRAVLHVENENQKPRCFMLARHRNPDFIGREDVLTMMDAHLLPKSSADRDGQSNIQFFSLCGMGGIGKTDLAVEYAHTRRDKFHTIIWLDAGSVSQLASDFGRIATELGLLAGNDVQSLGSSIEIAKAWLNKSPSGVKGDQGYDWLLIFDNADDLDIITDYIPYYGKGSVLVTSRDPYAKEQFFSAGSGFEMDRLPPKDSAALLCKLTKNTPVTSGSDEDDASLELADRLDGLPLAMIQMAGFIRRRRLSIREFIHLYSTDARYSEIHNVSNPLQDKRYGYTLATTYSFEGFSPHAMELLRVLAYLNPDRVQEFIFTDSQGPNPGENPYWTASTFEGARFELLSSSLIKRDVEKKELWVHRLVQTEVRTRIDVDDRYPTFRKAVSLIHGVWPPGNYSSQKIQRWPVCEGLLPHLERLYQLYVEYSTDWAGFQMDLTFLTLLNEASVYLHERGLSHEGKAYLGLALSLCEKAGVTTEPLISDMHLSMGALANETNDAQSCMKHNILCLTIRRNEAAKTNVPDLRLAFAHSQMGIAYMMVRKYALATEYFKQSVEMLKLIDADPDEFGFPVCNLGLAQWIQGELESADTTLVDLLLQREKLYGKLDRVSYKTGRVLQALGNVRGSMAIRAESLGDTETSRRRWAESFTIHRDCLVQYESTLGRYNHRTADACHKLAEHYIRLGDNTLAQDYLDRALNIWGDRQWFKNESARSSFLRGMHLRSLGGKENESAGNDWIDRAKILRKQILPDEDERELETVDFDELVCFWSR